MKPNDKVRESLFEVINNQIKENTPPETNETFKRLKGLGYSIKIRERRKKIPIVEFVRFENALLGMATHFVAPGNEILLHDDLDKMLNLNEIL
jgi:hypothetical protein